MSQSKLQFVKPEVKFLGHLIGRGYKKLGLERISGVLSIGSPKTKRGGRLWIEQNPERVKFLYEKLVSPDPIHRTSKDEKQLQSLKIKLSRALLLSLPNLNKDFVLFVSAEGGAAYGVLTPEWGSCRKHVVCLSKHLDMVARGWPVCLQAIAATAILLGQAQGVTLGE